MIKLTIFIYWGQKRSVYEKRSVCVYEPRFSSIYNYQHFNAKSKFTPSVITINFVRCNSSLKNLGLRRKVSYNYKCQL